MQLQAGRARRAAENRGPPCTAGISSS